VVAEDDLIAALESGQLWGAGVDVTEVEPLPLDSKLWSQPNVIITPHVGAQSGRRADVTTNFLAANLQRFVKGVPLRHLVDKKLGFPAR
jgi:D-3-phosphoglycerate dehydrogenase